MGVSFSFALTSLGLLFPLLFAVTAATQQDVDDIHTNRGRAFMISFIRNYEDNGQNSVIIVTELPTTVFIIVSSSENGSLTRLELPADYTFYIKLPNETTVNTWGTPEKKAVSVYSTELVCMYGITASDRTTGAYLAIPLDKWGHHYIVATYDGYERLGGEIIIISAEDNTSVHVTLNVVKNTRCTVTGAVSDTVALVFIVNKDEVLRVACDDDLTGSVVEASSPVGVISGNACTQVPHGTAFCDHVVEMMIPTTHLGQEYIVTSLTGRQSRFRVVFTQTKEPTELTILSKGAQATLTRTNHLYKEFQVEPDTDLKLNSSSPVLLVLYVTGTGDKGAITDPAMVIVPPVERFFSNISMAFNWSSLFGNSNVQFDLNVFSPGSGPLFMSGTPDGVQINSVEDAFDYKMTRASVWNDTFLPSNSFGPDSNIFVTASGVGSSAAFPLAIKMDLYAGEDNCSTSPCLHDGICFSHGSHLLCYCGDQLDGDRCENDIFNACASLPCQNGGSCLDLPYMFTCFCPEDFTGHICETAIPQDADTTTSSPQTTTSSPRTTTSSPRTTTSSPRTTTSSPRTTRLVTETTSQPSPTPAQKLCSCVCENITLEEIEETKEKIKQELIIDPKTTRKTRTKHRTTYDSRPSAAGIGILGVLFLVLVFGSMVLLDLISVVTYFSSLLTRWRRAGAEGKENNASLDQESAEETWPPISLSAEDTNLWSGTNFWLTKRKNLFSCPFQPKGNNLPIGPKNENSWPCEGKGTNSWSSELMDNESWPLDSKRSNSWHSEAEDNNFWPTKPEDNFWLREPKDGNSWPSETMNSLWPQEPKGDTSWSEEAKDNNSWSQKRKGDNSWQPEPKGDDSWPQELKRSNSWASLPVPPPTNYCQSQSKSTRLWPSKQASMDSSLCSKTYFTMPRFQIKSSQVLAVGKNGKAFKMRKPSWKLRRAVVLKQTESLPVLMQERSGTRDLCCADLSRHKSTSLLL